MNVSADAFLELGFPIVAPTIPADHGYVVFSAICSLLPELRIDSDAIPGLTILPVTGKPVGQRRLMTNAYSKLVFRLPGKDIPKLLPLAGKSLPLPGNSAMILGAPSIRSLEPARNLYSRLVTIKVRDLKESSPEYAERFLAAARRMAAELSVPPDCLSLVQRRLPLPVEGKTGSRPTEPWLRRTVGIKHKTIAGYALIARDLALDASLALQTLGLGGRRHFGCGVFVNHDRYPDK